MDRASKALAEGVPPGVLKSYRALADHRGVPRTTLHARAHGRRSIEAKAEAQQYLQNYEEKTLVDFLLHLSNLGQPVRIKLKPNLAFCVTRHQTESKRPPKPPGKNWSTFFRERHPHVEARRVQALDWNRHEKHIYPKVVHWFEVIERVLRDPAILAENVYNMDETGVMLSKLGSAKVLVRKSDLRKYRGARVKREVVTAIECISADGRCLNPMIIWPAVTHRSNWTTFDTPGWQFALHESGYTNSYRSLQWLKRIFDPETKERANGRPRVLICDGFGTHETVEILEFCIPNNIKLCRLPSHSSHKLQPLDVATFAPLKAAYRQEVEFLERGNVNKIGKEHFTALYCPARTKAFTPRNVKSGFASCGLFPFNPDRVLRTMVKPPEPMASEADKVTVGPCRPESYPPIQIYPPVESSDPQGAVPESPMTPVSIEGLVSLQKMILQQQTIPAVDETGRWRLQRLVQKLAQAAQMSFAKGVLQQNHIQFLMKINNEAKVRRSTRPVVLGTAVVMGHEELKAARAKRDEKDAAKEAKGKVKRGRKRKNLPEADDVRTELPKPKAKRAKRAKKSKEAKEANAGQYKVCKLDRIEPGSVPVARMY